MDTKDIEHRLIELFKNDPQAFMDMCLKQSEKNGQLPSFGKYVQLILNDKLNNNLSNSELAEKNELERKYGSINVDHLLKYKLRNPTVENIYEEIKENSTIAYEDVLIAHERNPRAGYAGFLEYCKSIKNNVVFAKGDISNKGAKYNIDNRRELTAWLKGFTGKDYHLTNDVVIRLKTKAFVHILLGHVRPFLVPRKGKLDQFTLISSCDELILLIDRIILQLEEELISHFSKGDSDFSKTEFQFEGLKYGIHINKKKEIKTFYEMK